MGRLPFGTGTAESVLARQAAGRLPNLAAARTDVPQSVVRVLEKGAAQHPGERWSSAEEYSRALRDAARPAQGMMSRFLRRLVGPS